MKNLILTGGGTAGHCTPALALLPHLKDSFDNIYYIGSRYGVEGRLAKGKGLKYYPITTVKLKRAVSASNLTIPFKLTKGIIEAKKLLKSLRASVVFSKGGYVALPVTIAAKQLGVPVVAHESDLSAGLANKIAFKFATEVLTSFKETAQSLPAGVWTGAPVSGEIFGSSRSEALRHYGIKENKPVLLALGGSSGSVAINRVLRGLLDPLTDKYTVLHLTGKNNSAPSLKGREDYIQVEFEDDMKYAYAAADVAVSRAGSNCLFELMAMKLPTLLIPLPKGASRGDQIENAEYFKKRGAFKVLPQELAVGQKFLEGIDAAYAERATLVHAQQKHFKDGTAEIAARIIAAAR